MDIILPGQCPPIVPAMLRNDGQVLHDGGQILLKGTFPGANLRAQKLIGGLDANRVEGGGGVLPPMLPTVNVPINEMARSPAVVGVGNDVKGLPGAVDDAESIGQQILGKVIFIFPGNDYCFFGQMMGTTLGESFPNDGGAPQLQSGASQPACKFGVKLVYVGNVMGFHIIAAGGAIVPSVDIGFVGTDMDIGGIGEQFCNLLD